MSDPLPRWGIVTAAPHEHLIHIRNGRVVRQQQGGSCWRWPGDSVALVDTSVRRLQFKADQVTREKTGVGVTGLAVFRIVEPTLAYRMLNLDQPGATTEILREMFVGACRRLIANLSLEDCMTRRKEALATELMAEIVPVVQGQGRAQDGTDRGWGIAIDTIEVQDVRVLSGQVFARLQAPYREKLALKALAAENEVLAERARLANLAEQSEEDRKRALFEQREARMAAEQARASQEAEHKAHLQSLAHQANLARVAQTDAQARAAGLADAQSRLRIAELEAEARRTAGAAEAAVTRLQREAMDGVSQARLQELALTVTLPQVAEAFAGAYDTAILTGGQDGVGGAVAQVLATAHAFGVRLPGQEV